MKNISEQFYNNNMQIDESERKAIIDAIERTLKRWKEPSKNDMTEYCEEMILWGIGLLSPYDRNLKLTGKTLKDGRWNAITLPIMSMSKIENGIFYVIAYDFPKPVSLFKLNFGSSLESALNTITNTVEYGKAAISYRDLLLISDTLEDASV